MLAQLKFVGVCVAPFRPDGAQWLKFDDERVDKADQQKAVEDNWGGDDERLPPGGVPGTGLSPGYLIAVVMMLLTGQYSMLLQDLATRSA
jgi:hypothetical protein